MTIARIDSRQSEWRATVDELHRIIPVDAEFSRLPSVLFGPLAFAVISSAAITDLPGEIEVFGGPMPDAADRRQGGRRARDVMLPDESDRQQDAFHLRRCRSQPLGDRFEESMFDLFGETGSPLEVSAQISGVGTPAG